MTTIVYDDFLNPPEDEATHIGMSHSRPVTKLETETIPNNLDLQLGGSTIVSSIAGGASVTPEVNSMMVNTQTEAPPGTVTGLGTDYDQRPAPLYEDTVVGDLLDSSDLAALESLVGNFYAALEAMEYAPPSADAVDPNQPVDLVTLMNEVEYADDGIYRANERMDTLINMRNELVEVGGVSQDQIVAFEQFFPNFITATHSLETFSRTPTRTNYRSTVASLEDLIVAASVAGLTLAIYAIAKMIKWIIEKVQKLRFEAKTDSQRAAYIQRLANLNKQILKGQQRFDDVIRKDPTAIDFLATAIDRVLAPDANGKAASVDETLPLVTLNIIFQNAYFARSVSGKYNSLHRALYTDQAQTYIKPLVALCNNLLVLVNSQYIRIKDLRETDIFNTDQLVVQDGNVETVARAFGVTTNDLADLAQGVQDKLTHLLDPLFDEPPAFADHNLKFKLDGSFDISDRAVGHLRNIGSTLKRWESDLNKITDPEVRANRAQIYGTLLNTIKGTAGLLAAVTTMHDSILVYISYMNKTVQKTELLWTEVFKRANVNFS